MYDIFAYITKLSLSIEVLHLYHNGEGFLGLANNLPSPHIGSCYFPHMMSPLPWGVWTFAYSVPLYFHWCLLSLDWTCECRCFLHSSIFELSALLRCMGTKLKLNTECQNPILFLLKLMNLDGNCTCFP